MNSMNNVEAVKTLVESRFTVKNTEIIDQYQIAFDVDKDQVHQLLTLLKLEGWKQLSYLSAIDWIDENEFEVVYIVMNWEQAVHIQVRARLDRDHPVMTSVLPIYPGAQYYEREAHEFFGIKFPGNKDHELQLILEEWDDIPPLRKDFDPRAYSNKKFAPREYTQELSELNGKESKQKKREARREYIRKMKERGAKK